MDGVIQRNHVSAFASDLRALDFEVEFHNCDVEKASRMSVCPPLIRLEPQPREVMK